MKIINYNFGKLSVGDNFIIGEMAEGADINIEEVLVIIDVARNHFMGKKWGYISNRVRSFSSHPIIHRLGPKFEKNMVAFAVISTKNNTAEMIELEKFLAGENYKFSVFKEIDKAISWVQSVISNEEMV